MQIGLQSWPTYPQVSQNESQNNVETSCILSQLYSRVLHNGQLCKFKLGLKLQYENINQRDNAFTELSGSEPV